MPNLQHKKLFYLILFTFSFLIIENSVFGEIQKKIINKIEKTHTMSFNFEQIIDEKKETGRCLIRYPKLLRCNYDDKKFQKQLISNGKTLVVIQRRYKKIFYYRLKSTPLYYILDKDFLVEFISNNSPSLIDENSIQYEIISEQKKIIVVFEKKTLNLQGWETIDIYNKKVNFFFKNLEINLPLEDKIFKIPNEENL